MRKKKVKGLLSGADLYYVTLSEIQLKREMKKMFNELRNNKRTYKKSKRWQRNMSYAICVNWLHGVDKKPKGIEGELNGY